MGGLFREYWRKAKSSPNKQLKAQIYLKMIMRKMVYTLTLLIKRETYKRVQFAPKGYQIYCKGISELQWQDNSHVIIKRAFGHGFTKQVTIG